MIITGNNMKKTSIALIGIASLSFSFYSVADSVFTWKEGNGHNSYSDVPRQLQPTRANTINIRTQTIQTPQITSPQNTNSTISEQQSKLSEKIISENKKIEEKNKKIDEENQRNKEDNCKAARLNRQLAEAARTNHREALLQRYDSDINKFCN